MQYYRSNKSLFDDANSHGGLFLISSEMCPFAAFKEFNISADTLDKMSEFFPDHSNINYLCKLRDNFPRCNLPQTAIYTFCDCLYKKLKDFNIDEIQDVESYAIISEWLFNIDENFNLTVRFHLGDIWNRSNQLSIECVSTIMFTSFCGNQTVYKQFVKHNLTSILTYLKRQTKSHKLYVDSDKNAIHVEYILRLRDIASANEESVSRLKYVCRALPIFDRYCSDALKPSFNLLSEYTMPDAAHKEMPIENVVIMFHQNMNSLWNTTIMSNYEFDTITEWLDYWFDLRELICLFADKCCTLIFKLLSGNARNILLNEVDELRKALSIKSNEERHFPKESRPFEEKPKIPEGLAKIKSDYFQSVQNFNNQFAGFISRDPEKQRLAIINLTASKSELAEMQNYFTKVSIEFGSQDRNSKLCNNEKQCFEQLMMYCAYYKEHSTNKFLNKYQIKEWYETVRQNEMEATESSLCLLQNKFSTHFPKESYTIKLLRYYPIIIESVNLLSESTIHDILLSCVPFAKTNFDYLVILFANESREIIANALQMPNRDLKMLIQTSKTEDCTLSTNAFLPYPVNVTQQMLDCFVEEYSLPIKGNDNSTPIGDIAEELWVYSKSRELLCDPEDANYLAKELKTVRSNIEKMLASLENTIPSEDINQLSGICRGVFDGDVFNDESFNNLVEHYIEKYKQ